MPIHVEPRGMNLELLCKKCKPVINIAVLTAS